MPRTIETTVYKFEELSERAKEEAIECCRHWGVEDNDWHEHVYEGFTTACGLIGVSVDHMCFSGFSSQGDGASFEGSYEYKVGWRKALRDEFGGNWFEKFEAFGQQLQSIQKLHRYALCARVERSNSHYSHSFTMGCGLDESMLVVELESKVFDEIEEKFQDIFRDIAHFLYRSLEDEHDYITGAEQVADMIIANEYEFTLEGELI